MGSSFAFWPCFAGLLFLVAGLISFRKEIAAAAGLDKLVTLASVFVAASLAVFGAEHLAGARLLMQGVPAWMPAHLFWAYFVGFALLATALSLTFKQCVRWSTLLLAIMIFLFVASIHIPNVVANAKSDLLWTVMLRDSAFAAGSLAFAAYLLKQPALANIARGWFALVVIFFGVEYFLHPHTAPGVPLAKLTPAWVPLAPLWGYLTGAVLFLSGIALLINKKIQTGRNRHRPHHDALDRRPLLPSPFHGIRHTTNRRRLQLRRRHALLRRSSPACRRIHEQSAGT